MEQVTEQRELSMQSQVPEAKTASGYSIVTRGRWLKIAQIHDEIWLEGQPVSDPKSFVSALQSNRCGADVFTFAQTLPETEKKYSYVAEWDNLAVARTTDFKAWWESLPQESRKNVRRSERRGLTTGPVVFYDALAQGIKRIYDETPIRQGRRFWHYQKDLEAVKKENATYLERSQFVGAHFNGELVGFIKMVFVDRTARIMQIISMNAHADKRPTNALLAKAMEICSQRPVEHLIYGQYIYDNKADSPVTEFKRRNGFSQVLLPRYYIPLTAKGAIALRLKFHRGIKGMLPNALLSALLSARQAYYERTLLRSRKMAC